MPLNGHFSVGEAIADYGGQIARLAPGASARDRYRLTRGAGLGSRPEYDHEILEIERQASQGRAALTQDDLDGARHELAVRLPLLDAGDIEACVLALSGGERDERSQADAIVELAAMSPRDVMRLVAQGEAALTVTAEHRQELAKSGQALPGGGFPVHDLHHLRYAETQYKQGHHGDYSADQVRAHLKKAAARLGVESKLDDDDEDRADAEAAKRKPRRKFSEHKFEGGSGGPRGGGGYAGGGGVDASGGGTSSGAGMGMAARRLRVKVGDDMKTIKLTGDQLDELGLTEADAISKVDRIIARHSDEAMFVGLAAGGDRRDWASAWGTQGIPESYKPRVRPGGDVLKVYDTGSAGDGEPVTKADLDEIERLSGINESLLGRENPHGSSYSTRRGRSPRGTAPSGGSWPAVAPIIPSKGRNMPVVNARPRRTPGRQAICSSSVSLPQSARARRPCAGPGRTPPRHQRRRGPEVAGSGHTLAMTSGLLMIASAGDLRLELAPAGSGAVALAAGWEPELAPAKVVLGLNPGAEPDGSPACGWCGRSHPPGGLADESMGGPEVHACTDGQDCATARDQREPGFIDHQYPRWRQQYDEYQRKREEEARKLVEWERSHAWGVYHPEQLAAWEQQVTPEFAAALAMVRDMVDERAAGYLKLAERLGGEQLELAAPAVGDQPAGAPELARQCADRECRHQDMRCPDNRTWTLGHYRSLPGVPDAAAALARRTVRSRPAG